MDWQDIREIPLNEPVKVLTVKGIVCLAKVVGTARWIRRPDRWVQHRRVLCRRLDGNTFGDVCAIGWVPAGSPSPPQGNMPEGE